MQKLILVIIVFLLFGQSTHVLANSENFSKEIERVEIGENSKIIYYKDGTKEIFVTCSWNMNLGSSVGVATVIRVPTPSPSIPIDEIFKIIKNTLDTLNRFGVVDTLLALTILNIIKRLRHGRALSHENAKATSCLNLNIVRLF